MIKEALKRAFQMCQRLKLAMHKLLDERNVVSVHSPLGIQVTVISTKLTFAIRFDDQI